MQAEEHGKHGTTSLARSWSSFLENGGCDFLVPECSQNMSNCLHLEFRVVRFGFGEMKPLQESKLKFMIPILGACSLCAPIRVFSSLSHIFSECIIPSVLHSVPA